MGYDPFDLDAQDQAAADKALREKLAREQEGADLQWLLGGPRGRRIVRRLLDQAGVTAASFSTNALQMAYAEGRRAVGCDLLTLIQRCCPEALPLIEKERNEHGSRNET